MNPLSKQTEWEKDFDLREAKIWQFAGMHPNFKSHTCEMVKEFIRSLLLSQRQEIVKNLKGVKITEKTIHTPNCQQKTDKNNHFFCSLKEREYGYNTALSDAISIITKGEGI